MRTCYKINGQKLKQIFIDKGINWNDASEALGHGRDYIPNVFFNNKVTIATANALSVMFGIKLEEYQDKQVEEPKEEAKVIEEPTTQYSEQLVDLLTRNLAAMTTLITAIQQLTESLK